MEKVKDLRRNFFDDRRVLVTGHTGFKGWWLSLWLRVLGAQVIGVALDPPSDPSGFSVTGIDKLVKSYHHDIVDGEGLTDIILDEEPDFVFHLAAQSLVRRSYNNPVETYRTNVFGTINLLESLRALADRKRCTAIFVTSDKCYENKEWIWGYREIDALGGADPYSASKGATELVLRSHCRSMIPSDGNLRVGVGRAGNVIGGGDWAIDRIVPDCVRAKTQKKPIVLRFPDSTRPWQHVLEPLSGYLTLATELHQDSKLHGEPFNFGPTSEQSFSVRELVDKLSEYWGQLEWSCPEAGVNEGIEAGLLKVNCDKALNQLNWRTVLDFDQTIQMTADWYRTYYEESTDIREFSEQQIRKYAEIAAGKRLPWAV